MLEDILRISNEWWLKEGISKEKAKPYKRGIFHELRDLRRERQILILTGLRRVGKTTLIYQLIESLLQGVKAQSILYFSFDERAEDVITILKKYGSITGTNWEEERVYVFFDEIHKLKDWSSKIKILYDNLPNLRITLSASSSLMIEKSAVKNLAGRYFLREVKPLSLKEFSELYLDKKIEDMEVWRGEVERIFNQYIKKPFPEIVKWTDEGRIREYIREMVIEKVVKIDLPEVFRNVNIDLLSSLLKIFMASPGMILNISSLSKDMRVHKLTLDEHIFYLEFSKIIRIIKNYRPSIMAESRKMKKVYPYHISLTHPFYPSLSEGRIFESLVVSARDLKNYWREGVREVDFVKRDKALTPIEVKAKNTIREGDLVNLLKFMKKYDVKKGIVIYKNSKKRTLKKNSYEIDLIPIIDVLS